MNSIYYTQEEIESSLVDNNDDIDIKHVRAGKESYIQDVLTGEAWLMKRKSHLPF